MPPAAIDDSVITATDEQWMAHAIELAHKAAELDEVPVGAVVVRHGQIVGEGWNQPITGCDATAHAEVMAIRAAGQCLGNYRLPECDLYVTIEPCLMCTGAMVHGRLRRLIYGAPEPKAGVVASRAQMLQAPFLNHQIEVCGGILEVQCAALISDFFRRRRADRKRIKQQLKGTEGPPP